MGFQESRVYDTTLEVKKISTYRSQAPEYRNNLKKAQANFVLKKKL